MDSDGQQDHGSRVPRFSKLILEDNIEAGKLVIPERFMRKHVKELQENRKVYLRVPPCTTWEMRLKRQANELFLHKGSWSRFMKFYNINYAHLLVFSYKGNSTLDVVIFDETATEITYPYQDNIESAIPKTKDLDDVVIVEEEDGDESNEVNFSRERSRVDEGRSPKSGASRNDVVERRSYSASPNTLNSMDPYFTVVIGTTYLRTTYGLHVPTKFARRYMGEKDCLVKFCDCGGKSWDVKFSFRKFSNQIKAKITTGWVNFARDNNLRVGDVCSFHLVKRNAPLHFRVAIFKAAKHKNHHAFTGGPSIDQSKFRQCSTSASQPKAYQNSRECSSERIFQKPSLFLSSRNSQKPIFSLLMTEHYMRRWNVPIKTSFLRHLKEKEQMVTLKVANRAWMVKAIRYPTRKGILSFGWYKFQADNNLQIGDLCVFKLIQQQDMVFEVSIHRARARGKVNRI